MTDHARAARFRALFRPDATGGVVWAPRPASDFSRALGLSDRAAAAAALDWTATKAGRPPQWRGEAPALSCRADRAPAMLPDICAALVIDLAAALAAARAAMASQGVAAARARVLRLCRLDAGGRIVWATRDDVTAPKTAPAARAAFNRLWAGRPLPIRAGQITVQRQPIDHAQALQWLSAAPAPTPSADPMDADLLDAWQLLSTDADIPAPGAHLEYFEHCRAQGLDPAQTADHLRRVCPQCADLPQAALVDMVAAALDAT
jgi:hypothetical protein